MNAKPKPGTAARLVRARKRLHKTIERAAKDAARLRDGCCRRCGSVTWLEAAHLIDAGSGGRHSVSSHQRDYVTLCRDCHRGPRSVHSGHIVITYYLRKGDGPVDFAEQRPGQRWQPVVWPLGGDRG